MRRDNVFLIVGLVASAVLAVGTCLLGYGLTPSLGVLGASLVSVRVFTYLYFERFLGLKTFEDFKSGKILHECIACGTCCRLKVNLGKDDVERIIEHVKERNLSEVVIEKRGSKYWLKRDSGECCFLVHSDGKPRCQIYPVRPVACRLYPLVPKGEGLRADPLCPGFNKKKGQTFGEFLRTQSVGSYVRRKMGKI